MSGRATVRGLLVLTAIASCTAGEAASSIDAAPPIDAVPPVDADVGPCSGCAAPYKCCPVAAGMFCLVVAEDRMNCGDCGVVCLEGKTNSCGGGMCKCGFGPACGNAETCCGSGCRDLATDRASCGECDRTCPSGVTCTAGECLCGATMCADGESCCDGTCVNLLADPANCGACGHACTGIASSCNDGTCGCPAGGVACPGGAASSLLMCCDSGCADLCSDLANCGACGHPCVGFDLCLAGGCFLAGEMSLPECDGSLPIPPGP